MHHEEVQKSLLRYIVNAEDTVPNGMTHPERLFIYQDGYYLRIRDSLEETFPLTASVLGDDEFMQLACGFALEHSFPGFDLFSVAEGFEVYLRGLVADLPYAFLPDLAELELKCARAFHAPQSKPLTAEAFSQQLESEPEHLVLLPQAYVALNESRFPLNEIANDIKNSSFVETTDLDWPAASHYQLIYRAQWLIQQISLEHDQYFLLQRLIGGQSLLAACSDLEDFLEKKGKTGDLPPVHEWLNQWVERELFKD